MLPPPLACLPQPHPPISISHACSCAGPAVRVRPPVGHPQHQHHKRGRRELTSAADHREEPGETKRVGLLVFSPPRFLLIVCDLFYCCLIFATLMTLSPHPTLHFSLTCSDLLAPSIADVCAPPKRAETRSLIRLDMRGGRRQQAKLLFIVIRLEIQNDADQRSLSFMCDDM